MTDSTQQEAIGVLEEAEDVLASAHGASCRTSEHSCSRCYQREPALLKRVEDLKAKLRRLAAGTLAVVLFLLAGALTDARSQSVVVMLSPATITIEVGQSTRVEARLLDSDWIRVAPTRYTWLPPASEPPAIASERNCSAPDADGVFKALRPGQCWVSFVAFWTGTNHLGQPAPVGARSIEVVVVTVVEGCGAINACPPLCSVRAEGDMCP